MANDDVMLSLTIKFTEQDRFPKVSFDVLESLASHTIICGQHSAKGRTGDGPIS